MVSSAGGRGGETSASGHFGSCCCVCTKERFTRSSKLSGSVAILLNARSAAGETLSASGLPTLPIALFSDIKARMEALAWKFPFPYSGG